MLSLFRIVAASLVVGCANGDATPPSTSSISSGARWDISGVIPDAQPEGVRLGPVLLDQMESFEDVGLRVDIRHGSPADVEMWLCYDEDNDGADDVLVPIELHMGRRGGWDEPEPYACPQELDGEFYWGGVASSLLDELRGHESGGAFTLVVSDSLAGDVGVVRSWSMQHYSAPKTAL